MLNNLKKIKIQIERASRCAGARLHSLSSRTHAHGANKEDDAIGRLDAGAIKRFTRQGRACGSVQYFRIVLVSLCYLFMCAAVRLHICHWQSVAQPMASMPVALRAHKTHRLLLEKKQASELPEV